MAAEDQRVQVWVDESAGRGWQLHEEENLAEWGYTAKGQP